MAAKDTGRCSIKPRLQNHLWGPIDTKRSIIGWTNLGRPKKDPWRIALAVSGDNVKLKEVDRDLLDQKGLDYFDNGRLQGS